MSSNAEIDKDNIIPVTYEHLPEDVRLLLEKRKKMRDEEDLLAALASIKVDRRGKVTKIKEVDFASTSTDASTEVTPAASDSSSGVTLEQVQKLVAEGNVLNCLYFFFYQRSRRPARGAVWQYRPN